MPTYLSVFLMPGVLLEIWKFKNFLKYSIYNNYMCGPIYLHLDTFGVINCKLQVISSRIANLTWFFLPCGWNKGQGTSPGPDARSVVSTFQESRGPLFIKALIRTCTLLPLGIILGQNPNGAPCFAWKRHCFEGLTFKNRGLLLGIYIYIPSL